ncbi:Na+/H+ antiporter subunit E [Spirochaeta dissipatitropha]
MMKLIIQSIRNNAGLVFLLSVVWMILNESISLHIVLSGPIVAVVVLFFTNRLVLKADYQSFYRIRPFVLFRYCIVLLKEIYVAGFHAMEKIITKKVNINIVGFDTKLTDPFHISLLANSITLTPGTVTMEKSGQHLEVIWIDAHTQDPDEAGREIMGSFERMLIQSDLLQATENSGKESNS